MNHVQVWSLFISLYHVGISGHIFLVPEAHHLARQSEGSAGGQGQFPGKATRAA